MRIELKLSVLFIPARQGMERGCKGIKRQGHRIPFIFHRLDKARQHQPQGLALLALPNGPSQREVSTGGPKCQWMIEP